MSRPVISRFTLFFIAVFMLACEGNAGDEETGKSYDEKGIVVDFDTDFQITIPQYFQEMYDINPKADLQYGFINKEKDSASADFEDEVYVTILMLPKSELAPTFSDSGRITLSRVNDRTAINLELILDDFTIGNPSPSPTLINGLPAIRNDFSGRLGQYRVAYKMGLYETETDFYQLLTWCMEKHKSKHNSEMDAMINSIEKK
ncbi:MAG: hypothetical protein AB8B72_01035 [Crocinitomicaceae bacterium]